MITTKLSQSKLNLKISKQTNQTAHSWEWNVKHICTLSYSPLSPIIPVSKYNVCPSLHSMDFNYYIFLMWKVFFPTVIFWWIACSDTPFVLSLDRCLLLVRWLKKKIFFQVSTVKADSAPSPPRLPLKPLNLFTYTGLCWQFWSETLKRIFRKDLSFCLLFVDLWNNGRVLFLAFQNKDFRACCESRTGDWNAHISPDPLDHLGLLHCGACQMVVYLSVASK